MEEWPRQRHSLFFAVLCRRTAFCFAKDPAEIIPAAEAELFGNFLNGESGAVKQDFGAFYFGLLYIIADAHTGLFLESTRQIVFRITGQFCKILCTDFFSI